jgi:hypothetical protein
MNNVQPLRKLLLKKGPTLCTGDTTAPVMIEGFIQKGAVYISTLYTSHFQLVERHMDLGTDVAGTIVPNQATR